MAKKVTVYMAQPGSYLTFTDERGLDNALDLSHPLAVVRASEYTKLREQAKRVALRAGFTAEALHDLLDLITE